MQKESTINSINLKSLRAVLSLICISALSQNAFTQVTGQCWETSPSDRVRLANIKTRVVNNSRNFLQVNASPDAILASEFYFVSAERKFKMGSEISDLPSNIQGAFEIDPGMLYTNSEGNKTIIQLPDSTNTLNGEDDVRIVSSIVVEPERNWKNFGRQYQFRSKMHKKFNSIQSIPDPIYADNGATIMEPLPLDNAIPTVIGFSATHSNALIKIYHKSVNSRIWQQCVGTHLGNGDILTARHCLNDDYLFQFGNLSVDRLRPTGVSQNYPDLKGVLECSGNGGAGESSIKLVSGDHLDAAILSLPSSFSSMSSNKAREFQSATFNISPDRSAAKTFSGPDNFALITIWPVNMGGPIAYDLNGVLVKPEQHQRVIFRPDPEKDATFNCQNHHKDNDFRICAVPGSFTNAREDRISRESWRTGCPAEDGTSGSPVFDATDPTHIVAVVSADSISSGTCVAPVYFPQEQ